MIPLSAAQAISPAFDRTKQFLFQPFRLGRFLKLTLVAVLTEGGMYSFSGGHSSSMGQPGGTGGSMPMPPMHWPAMAALAGLGIVIACIVIPIALFIGYLLIRLRFSYFDCVLRMQDRMPKSAGGVLLRAHLFASVLSLTSCRSIQNEDTTTPRRRQRPLTEV